MFQSTYKIILEFKLMDFTNLFSKDNLIELIKKEEFEIEYGGGEQDNQADYIDEEMQTKIDNHSYVTFYFDLNSKLVHNIVLNTQEVSELLINQIKKNELKEVRNYGKDLDIYIH